MRAASAITPDDGPSASGHGNFTIVGELQTVSFHVREKPDGTDEGSLVAKSRGQDARIKADLDCLRILPDGRTAVMSGVVTQSNNPAFPEGSRVLFRARDNGEGSNDPPDLMSDIAILPPTSPLTCNIAFGPPLLVPEAGNIQVKP